MCQFMCSWCSVRYHAVLCLLVAGYLEIKLKTEQVASNECCLPRKHAFMQLSTNFGKSIPTSAYQTFLFYQTYKTRHSMWQRCLLCPKNKSRDNFYDDLCYSHESLSVI